MIDEVNPLTFLFATVYLVLPVLLSGCGPANGSNVSHHIEETRKHMATQSWQHAGNEIKNVEDAWQYVRGKYEKKDAKRFEKLIHELELSIAVSDTKASYQIWEDLHRLWEKMNKTTSAIRLKADYFNETIKCPH